MRMRRRTQAERSRETTTKILESTLQCILDHGLMRTSTTEVAKLAGVSRGALLHHFPAKETLMIEALHYLLRREVDAADRLAASMRNSDLDIDAFVDHIWARFSGDLYMVSLEFVNASRTDPKMRKALIPVAAEFNDSYFTVWEKLVGPLKDDESRREQLLALTATLSLARGLTTQTIWRDDPELFSDTIEFWKKMLHLSGVIKDKAKS